MYLPESLFNNWNALYHIRIQMWNWTLVATIVLASTFRSIHGASKYYTGVVRPYEFGFSLEGNQHRHEMKDARGIIMGEFGFITADGVYHVTVYATDEDGNFKVTSRKNIRLMKIDQPINSLPKINVPATASPFMIKLTGQTPKQYPSQPTFEATMPTLKPNQPVTGCSGCKIPDLPLQTSTIPSTQPPPFKVYTTTATLPQKLTDSMRTSTVTAPTSEQFRNINGTTSMSGNNKLDFTTKITTTATTTTTANTSKVQTNDDRKQNNLINDLLDVHTPDTGLDTGRIVPQPLHLKSEDNSNAYRRNQPTVMNGYGNGEGTMKEILNGLLYRFNYNVGYHGHKEEGDRRGTKKGEYYIIGRDGVKRIVSYEANEFGFQPNTKSVIVRTEETPQIDTEREAGLKGYEFKWFYA